MTVPLGDLCRIELGRTPARAHARLWDTEKTTNNVWLSISDMPDTLHAVATDSREYVADSAAKDMRLVPEGALLVSFKLTLGRLCYAGRDLYTNEAIASLLDIDRERLSKEYLYWYLTFFDWDGAAEGDEKVKGKTLNKAKLKLLPVLIPPLDEQKRIVAMLDQAFAAIDRVGANAEANLSSVNEFFRHALDSEFVAIADEAASLPLQDAVHPDCGLSYGIVQPGDEIEHGLPIVRPVDLTQREVGLVGLKQIAPDAAAGYARTTLQGGELLLCVRGSTGAVSVASRDLAGANVTRGIVPVRFDEGRVLRDFAYFQFLSTVIRKQVADKTYGAALMQINIKDLRELRFLLPDIRVQREVVSRAEHLLKATSDMRGAYEGQLADTIALRQSLLQAAFSGQLT